MEHPNFNFLEYGSFGLLSLVVVFALFKGLPHIIDKFGTTITNLVTEFRHEQKEQREMFRNELENARVQYKESLDNIERECREHQKEARSEILSMQARTLDVIREVKNGK